MNRCVCESIGVVVMCFTYCSKDRSGVNTHPSPVVLVPLSVLSVEPIDVVWGARRLPEKAFLKKGEGGAMFE